MERAQNHDSDQEFDDQARFEPERLYFFVIFVICRDLSVCAGWSKCNDVNNQPQINASEQITHQSVQILN